MKNMFIDFTDNFSTTAAVYNILRESIDNEIANGEIITEDQPLYMEFIAFGEAITNDEASYYFTPMMDELRSGKEKPITSAMFNDSIHYNTFHIGNGLDVLALINTNEPNHDGAIFYDEQYVIQIGEYLNTIVVRPITNNDRQFLARQNFINSIAC